MKRKTSKKSVALLVSLVLVLGAAVGGTIAWMFDQTEAVTNTFTVATVSTDVEEDTTGGVKSNVKIKNTGDIPAYIRATVVVTWQDEDGNVYGKAPEERTDYRISYNTSDQADPVGKWTKAADGFWYWSKPVAAKALTGELITRCEPVEGKTPEGYGLNVEIIGSGIQAMPADAVKEAWASGVSGVTGTTLTIK